MVGKGQGTVQWHAGHVTRHAIPLSMRLCVAAQTALIVERIVSAACVHMREVTGGALELLRGVATTHRQTKRLEPDVLSALLIPWHLQTMTCATEFDLRVSAQLPGINWVVQSGILEMLFGAGVAALALNPGNQGF